MGQQDIGTPEHLDTRTLGYIIIISKLRRVPKNWKMIVCLEIIVRQNPVCNPLFFCQTPVLGLGVDITFAWDNNNNNNDNDKNPNLDFLRGTVQRDKEQGVGIGGKG